MMLIATIFDRILVTDHFGRRYLNVIPGGWLCLGFGPVAFIERIWLCRKLVYYDRGLPCSKGNAVARRSE